LQAAFFLARGRDERAELGFEEHVLAFLGAERDHQRNRVFREFGDRGTASAAPDAPPGDFAGSLFRHVGGDCTPNSVNGKENWSTGLGHLKMAATPVLWQESWATFRRRLCGRR
jgi:hypothetical protein